MGLISSLAAPSAPQFQSLMVKLIARVALAMITPPPDRHATAQKLRAEAPTEAAPRPILSAVNSGAVLRHLLPLQPAQLETGEDVDSGQIETPSEVDGIGLDGIPYLRDGAVLLDDLPQAEAAPAAKARPAEAITPTPAAAPPLHPDIEAQVEPARTRSAQAERAYHEERQISAVWHEATPHADAAAPDQINLDPPDPIAPSVDKRA